MLLGCVLIITVFIVWILGTFIYFEKKAPSKTMLAVIKSVAMSIIILCLLLVLLCLCLTLFNYFILDFEVKKNFILIFSIVIVFLSLLLFWLKNNRY